MPWNAGIFSRDNGVYSGSTVWTQEAADGSPEIQAGNHDTHDQDLADGINASLAKNGSNAMTGNLDLGSNSIVNGVNATYSGTVTANAFVGDGSGITGLGTNDISINKYGNSEGGFALAVAALVGTNKTLVLDPDSPLVLSGNTQYNIYGMGIKGMSSFTLGDYSKGGVIQITGTTTNPLYLGSGAIIDGVTFYYPNQVTTLTPTVYPATIRLKNTSTSDQASNVTITNNVFVNSYIAIETNGTSGAGVPSFIRITGNKGCVISKFIDHPSTLTECYFDGNEFSYAWWLESIGQDIRTTINNSGIGIVIGDCDGTFIRGNIFFGMKSGFKFESTSAITTLNGNVIDGCRYAIDISDADQVGNLNVCGNSFNCKDPITSSFTACAGLYGAIGQTITGQITLIGNHFGATDGEHINIEQLVGNCFLRLNIDGDFFNAGRNDAAGVHQSIRIIDTTNNATVSIRGLFEDSLNGGNNLTAVEISGCDIVDIDGIFDTFDNGVSITTAASTNRYRVGGIFRSVTSELSTSGTGSGQVKVGSLFSSDLTTLQNQVVSANPLDIVDNSEEFFVVTGTTGFNNINGAREGRRITLKFNGALTVTDATGNLRLAGNFTTSGNDTLTLVSDGTNWYEVGRSAN